MWRSRWGERMPTRGEWLFWKAVNGNHNGLAKTFLARPLCFLWGRGGQLGMGCGNNVNNGMYGTCTFYKSHTSHKSHTFLCDSKNRRLTTDNFPNLIYPKTPSIPISPFGTPADLVENLSEILVKRHE